MPANIEVLRVYQKVGTLALLALAGLVPFISEHLKFFETIDKLPIALYAFTIALLGMWIHSTWYELNYILNKWLDPRDYVVPQGLHVAAMITIMVGVLAFLFVSVPKIERYVAIFTFYSFFNLYGSAYTLSQIAYAVQETKKRPSTEDVNIAVDAIQEYWVKNIKNVQPTNSVLFPYKIDGGWHSWLKSPYFMRLVICFFVSLSLLPITIIAKKTNSLILEQISYVSMILIIVISESVIYIWRLKRDERIQKADTIAASHKRTQNDN